jgi:hypothetical protein
MVPQSTLANAYVTSIAQIFINSIGFTFACGYTIEIDSVYDVQLKTLELFSCHEFFCIKLKTSFIDFYNHSNS